MNDIEQLRAEVAELRTGLPKAMVLLTHALSAGQDARLVLQNAGAQFAHEQERQATSPSFDAALSQVLLALSSLAVKQYPSDPQAQAIYQGLRAGERH